MKNSSPNQNNNSVINEANYYFQEGNSFYFLGSPEKAIEAYTQVIKLNPNCANAYYNRGIVHSSMYSHSQGHALQGYDDFKKVIEINPNDAEAYFHDGNRSLAVLGRRPEAYMATLEAYNYAIKLNPNFADAYYNRYKILLTLNNPTEAIIDGKKAVELKSIGVNGIPLKDLHTFKAPGQLIYNYNIRLKMKDADIYSSPLEKNQKTLEIYNQNIKDNYYNKGKLLNSIGYEEEAFNSFLKGFEINQTINNNEIVQNQEILLKKLTTLHAITKDIQNILDNSNQDMPKVKEIIYFLQELKKLKLVLPSKFLKIWKNKRNKTYLVKLILIYLVTRWIIYNCKLKKLKNKLRTLSYHKRPRIFQINLLQR
ncbi:hypothetical protein A3306_06680 [Rickettsia bellii]|uniref:Tetratricopeptide repeat family protein n=1 Tax=Rickettsia bellii str. RML An4 TaxID=1359193 RepID=A0A0F3QDG6_RICBE|nr:tetratricopeptide repeat protein [Rickettsia bellii]ARD86803.1 hypothetical protein A3306_06680 [Rickettsia bellii]KJV89489.1 tetratricopeptide repeat family protein [Rickettsia bellii str. RML An4]